MATVEMSFTPLPAHVRTARLVATAVARRSGVAETLLDEVRLAVGEACSRAVEAHQAACPAEPVRVALGGQGGRFEVVVTDAVPPGDDGQAPVMPAPPLGEEDGAGAGLTGATSPELGLAGATSGELGLAVIAGLADDVEIARTADGLSIRMSWPSAPSADVAGPAG